MEKTTDKSHKIKPNQIKFNQAPHTNANMKKIITIQKNPTIESIGSINSNTLICIIITQLTFIIIKRYAILMNFIKI